MHTIKNNKIFTTNQHKPTRTNTKRSCRSYGSWLNKRVIVFVLVLLLPVMAYARGEKQVITETADGIDIWQKEFDVSGLKPGTYNIIVNAKDAAGNVGTSGPFNVKIDPQAGLPEVRVVYPDQGQVVREDLTIVGVAASRYGLKRIEIKINDGEYQELAGEEFWSFRVPAADLPEGKHTIFVRAVDVQDFTGPESKTEFILDINPSDIEITSHAMGDRISGTAKISGTIYDANKVQSLSFSTDGQKFTPLRLSSKRNDDNGYFQFSIPSKRHHDGPLVYYLRAVNGAGRTITSPFLLFVVNNQAEDNAVDNPTVILTSPVKDELITRDFAVRGIAFSASGIAAVHWRVLVPANPRDTVAQTIAQNSGVEFNRLDTNQNFSVSLPLGDVSDGENILEIYAEDVYGVTGETIQQVFKVSTAPPETRVAEPVMTSWNRGNIMVRGTSADRNGIAELLLSMDNGISYQRANFTSVQDDTVEWDFSLNTKAYADGMYSMLIRTIDTAGVSSFSNCIINIDNTAPVLDIGSPRNGDRIGVTLFVTGQVYDNIELASASIQFINIASATRQQAYDLSKDVVIMESIDVSAFPDGEYTLKITARDQAENETSVIRNVTILKAAAASEIALMNPLPGIDHCGPLVVSGRISGAVIPDTVTLMMNQRSLASVEVNRYGIFRYELPDDVAQSADGPLVFSASFQTPGGEQIDSFESAVTVQNVGPVLLVDSHHDGDVVTHRPWIMGRALYVSPPAPETDEMDNVKVSRKAAKLLKDPAASKVEISLNNGRTFVQASGTSNWKYRLETGGMETGMLPLVIKATFDNGTVAVRRMLITVDTNAPMVHTIGPPENSSHRTSVLVYGSSSDEFDMDTIEVSLRSGDKFNYATPAFIQGLYVDTSFLGGLVFSNGLGLTFFDDNVKVQVNAAKAPPETRYSGWAFGGKIIANIFAKNLGDWFGPDWSFYTTSIAIGAQFLYYMMDESEDSLWMSQLIGQWEIVKADLSYFFPKWKYFKTFSLYVEPGLWFAPSDVSSEQAWRTKFTIAFGGRISLF